MKRNEAKLIVEFFEELGYYTHEYGKLCEFETWTKAGINIIIDLEAMTFQELDEYLDSRDTDYCDERIMQYMQDERFRKQFTLKQAVDDIYNFWDDLQEKWNEYKRKFRD